MVDDGSSTHGHGSVVILLTELESAVSFKQFECLNLACTIVREEIVKQGWEISKAEDKE
jgi:hypothetical protein